MAVTEQTANPLSQFLYAFRAPETKRWLKVVFDFLDLHGDLDTQAGQFMTLYKEVGLAVVHEILISFISYQVQRAEKKEISRATIPNYSKVIKLLCEMNDGWAGEKLCGLSAATISSEILLKNIVIVCFFLL
jgi:hypothetical protein